MENVGEILRAEREKKGLSIKEIEAAISIRALYITAIEEGNYSIVPGEVYLKGFIRNYANYLGLNGPEIVASYRQAQQPVEPEEIVAPVEKPVEPTAKTRTKRTPENNSPNSSTNNSKKLLLLGLLAICVVGSAWLVFGKQAPTKEIQETKQVQPAPTIPAPAEPAKPVAPVQNKPVVIVAKYTEPCWTSVVADGKQIYEGTVKDGETITWEAQKNITLTAGNANGIEITYNGQSLGKLGKKGEVLVKNYVAKQ